MELLKKNLLRKAFEAPVEKQTYDPKEALTVNVDISLCTDEERPRMVHIVNRLANRTRAAKHWKLRRKQGISSAF